MDFIFMDFIPVDFIPMDFIPRGFYSHGFCENFGGDFGVAQPTPALQLGLKNFLVDPPKSLEFIRNRGWTRTRREFGAVWEF